MPVRSAIETDAPAISRLISSLSHSYCEAGCDVPPAWFVETITPPAIGDRIGSDHFQHFVYVQDNEVVGYIALKDGDHLYHLFVAAGHQGQGLARRLWEHARSQSPADRFTVRSSLYAVPVYERLGFRPSGAVGNKDGILFQPMQYEV